MTAHQPSLDEAQALRALRLEEISSLRAELNATIDRMNGNENFAAGAVSAIFAFVLSNQISLLSIVLTGLALAVSLLGIARFYELKGHFDALDRYIAEAERIICPDGGWSAKFADQPSPRSGFSFTATRRVFWGGLVAASLTGAAFVLISLG
ncbi:MAG: hypothetical protein AAFU49_13430 [Pseudomonadota bacterium]